LIRKRRLPTGNIAMKYLFPVTLVLALSMSPAFAADRYAVIERGDTIIRVDTRTGSVSFCGNENGKPVCKLAADERKAWMREVQSLEEQVEVLRGQAQSPDGKAPQSSGELSKKEEKEIDKAMRVAETMMRRLFGIMRTLKRDMEAN